MNETEYQDFLKKAPQDHFSDEFITFLMQNNKVRKSIGGNWLVIENVKYRTNENDWLTAFYIGQHKETLEWPMYATDALWKEYHDREWLIKHPKKRSVKLFHVHLIAK